MSTTDQLPQDLNAEDAVLGSLLMDRDAILPIAPFLTAAMFSSTANGMIYAAALACVDRRVPTDLINLCAELKRRGQLDLVGGPAALIGLSNSVPTAVHVEFYAQAVQRAWLHRQVISVAGQIGQLGYDTTLEPDALLAQSADLVLKLSEHGIDKGFVSMETLADELWSRIKKNMDSDLKISGLPTGFADLDKHTGGLQKSDLILLAARPAVGKTSLALNIAVNAAQQGMRVAIFSLEMSQDQLMQRMLSTATGIDMHRMRTGRLDEADLTIISTALGEMSSLAIEVDDTAAVSLAHVRAKARRLQAERGLDLIIIDYLQLMTGSFRKDGNKVQEVSEISRGLKVLGRDLDVPILGLSQLSRAVESRTSKVPMLSDLRDSGSLEQDADIVMFLYREELYDPETDKKGVAELHIAKHRNGPTGVIPLRFFKATTRFADLETYRQPEGYGQPADAAPRGFGYDD